MTDDISLTENLLKCVYFQSQKAKRKKIVKMAPKDLGIELKTDLEVLDVSEPPVREAGIKVDDVPQLLSKLKETGVI